MLIRVQFKIIIITVSVVLTSIVTTSILGLVI